MCQIVKKSINFRIILYLNSIQGVILSLTLKILKKVNGVKVSDSKGDFNFKRRKNTLVDTLTVVDNFVKFTVNRKNTAYMVLI
jgi:hypothetical protein